MKIFVVMVESWNGEYDETSIYKIFAKLEDASACRKVLMAFPEGRSRSSYYPTYYVEEIDLIGA